MQTVAEASLFFKQAAAIFTDNKRKDLIDFLPSHSQIGDEIPGAGGVRKLRFGAKGKGKRGGARVIYGWYSEDAPIYASRLRKERKDGFEAGRGQGGCCVRKGDQSDVQEVA